MPKSIMDIIRKCPDCKVKHGKITVCGDIEHLCALEKIAKLPKSKQRPTTQGASHTSRGRPEPAWNLTSKTCPEIAEGEPFKIWVPPYMTTVNIQGHTHNCEWRVSKAGKDYCLVHPCSK